MKPKYGEEAKLCYIDTDSFIVYIKAHAIYKDISKDVETRFGNSNHQLNKLLLKKITMKKKKVIGLMKEELAGKIIKVFVGLR